MMNEVSENKMSDEYRKKVIDKMLVRRYFESCVAYWESMGYSKGVATVRALWWDCVEAWNIDKSWTDVKVEFINQYRKYEPYGPVPEESRVAEGNA